MRRVLTYGGTGGIGLAAARCLRARSYGLHLAARDPGRLEAAAAELGETTNSTGDVAHEDFFARATEAAGAERAGLVYAVGTINLRPLARLTRTDAETDFRLNALGAFSAVQAAAGALRAGAAVTGAVEGLALAAEMNPQVRVNVVAPSLTRTPLASAITGNATLAQSIASLHALQRLGEPEGVARLAALPVSEEAAWITGQVIGVDGGRATLRIKG